MKQRTHCIFIYLSRKILKAEIGQLLIQFKDENEVSIRLMLHNMFEIKLTI